MLAGGADASISPLPYAGFCAARAMSKRNDCVERASRPFDKSRDGFVMGEGSGVVVLERLDHALNRDAGIYAELTGYGNTSDAFHFTAPEPEGERIRADLRQVGLRPGPQAGSPAPHFRCGSAASEFRCAIRSGDLLPHFRRGTPPHPGRRLNRPALSASDPRPSPPSTAG